MSTPTPRDEIANLPAYVPGKAPTPRPGVTPHKLSSNENPHPPLPAILQAAADAAANMNRYPDMGCTTLYGRLAEKFGLGTDQFAAGTGSVAVLYHLLQAYCRPGDEVVHAWRSFEAYPIAVSVAGAVDVQVPLNAAGEHDLDAMAAAVTDRTRVVIVCTPNNPTGPAITHTALAAFLDQIPPHVIVVIDEAYVEFVRSDDPVDSLALLRIHPNVVVMRTFAKAYGLAGLRVGYAMASAEIAGHIRACALPFGVSSIAQAVALAALDHEAELLAQVDAIVAERDRVAATLAKQGWEIPDPQGNFVWLALGDRTPGFVAAAEEVSLMVRPFAGEGVRVSIGTPDANDTFLAVADKFRA